MEGNGQKMFCFFPGASHFYLTFIFTLLYQIKSLVGPTGMRVSSEKSE